MANYLDKDGLLYFWQKIKNVFAQKTEIPTKTSDLTNDSNFAVDASYVHTDNNYTSAEKTKLSGIAAGAEVNQNAFSNVKVGSTTIAADGKTDTVEFVAGSNVTLTPDATNDKVTIAATDTTYSDATTSASGLMSASDKTKLNGIATGAEVNQNAFSNVKVGSTTVQADAKTDTLELVAGDNVTLTPDATNDKITIAATDTTYSNATQSAAGLMSSADKTKLDGIEAGAEVNVVTDVKLGTTSVLSNGVATIGAASSSANGYMPSSIYKKIEEQLNIVFGTIATAAGTAAKIVEIPGTSFYSLKNGTILFAKSTYTNSASSPTFALKFGSNSAQTAYAVKYNNAAATGGYAGQASRIGIYVFESGSPSCWHWIGWSYETNTTYSDATTTTHGLMSTSDKTKLNGIATGAEVNQNAFSNVKVGSTTVEADAKTDTLEFVAGSNVTLTPDATNDKITIAATDTTYSEATTSAAGLMSSSDKTKLDSIQDGAEINQAAYTFVKAGNWTISASGKMSTLTMEAGNNVTITSGENHDRVVISATDTTYSNATQSAAGLMSSTDKTKLDGFSAASNYALKSDISGMYKFKGSVATESLLPSSGQTTGDVYNIEAASSYGGAGMNVAWDGSAWDPLGEIFTITSVTNAEIDTIVAS